MKARVKETGKIFDVYGVVNKTCDGYGIGEVDLIVDDKDSFNYDMTPAYWEKLRHEYVGMAMNALLLTNNIRNGDLEGMRECNTNAMAIAHALVDELKEKCGCGFNGCL